MATRTRRAKTPPTEARTSAPEAAAAIAATDGRPPTYFDDTTWGMTPAELSARYSLKFGKGRQFATLRHEVAGVPIETSFRLEDGGLTRISMAVLRRYAEWGDGDQDESAIVRWISARAGPYTTRTPASVKWELPTVKIWTFCDESLGAYFERPR